MKTPVRAKLRTGVGRIGSAIGDVHRHFEAETHLGELGLAPLHGGLLGDRFVIGVLGPAIAARQVLARRMSAGQQLQYGENCMEGQGFDRDSAASFVVRTQHPVVSARTGAAVVGTECVSRGTCCAAGKKTGDRIVRSPQESRIAGVKRGGVRIPAQEVGRHRKGGGRQRAVPELAGWISARRMPEQAMSYGMRVCDDGARPQASGGRLRCPGNGAGVSRTRFVSGTP